MGYTHYWKMPDKLMDEKVLNDIQKIIEECEDVIQVEWNEKGEYSGFEEPEHLIQKNITNSSRISIVKGE